MGSATWNPAAHAAVVYKYNVRDETRCTATAAAARGEAASTGLVHQKWLGLRPGPVGPHVVDKTQRDGMASPPDKPGPAGQTEGKKASKFMQGQGPRCWWSRRGGKTGCSGVGRPSNERRGEERLSGWDQPGDPDQEGFGHKGPFRWRGGAGAQVGTSGVGSSWDSE